MAYIVGFHEAAATEQASVGGKGANLGKLTQAGFAVPPGFNVTTDAYHDFVASAGLSGGIGAALDGIDYDDSGSVETGTAQIRQLIVSAQVPAAIATAVTNAYDALGDGSFVAVRSSGTAEDLAEASFAGQHDTYLDVRGGESLLDAVQRCWASMWTARATAYRRHHGIDHHKIGLGVVVQQMITAEVAGVLFTANPMTGRTDEIVVNASWGLGEGVVSGILTPDQFVLAHGGLRLKRTEIGTKEVRVVRDESSTRGGTITEDVPAAQRTAASLSPAQLADLGALGLRVQDYYEGFPQDLEWAHAGGRFYLLQSRDITGVDLCWDHELDEWNDLQPPVADDTTWTRNWADVLWPGASTPMFYSLRSEWYTRMHIASQTQWGISEVAQLRPLRYHRGRVYFNSAIDYGMYQRTLPGPLRRPEMLVNMPVAWREKCLAEPTAWTDPLKILARIAVLDPDHSMHRCLRAAYDTIENKQSEADGLSDDGLSRLTDKELKQYLDGRVLLQTEWTQDLWTPLGLYLPAGMSLLTLMVEKWYTGSNAWIVADFITGLPRHTATLKENLELWELSERIRASDELRAALESHQGRAFFAQLEHSEVGREFLAAYGAFVERHGHRGHPDRDIYGDRRREDPTTDYVMLRSLLTADAVSPEQTLTALVAQREAAAEDMISSIRKQPFSGLKVEAFKLVYNFVLRLYEFRDDERHYTDRITMSKKRAMLEVVRRLRERGLVEGDDFWFMSKQELYRLLDGDVGRARLRNAIIAQRRRAYEQVQVEPIPPMYLQGDTQLDLDAPPAEAADDGLMRGVGTSRGQVTGTARIVPTQRELGRVRKGDILITASTDPGWTPVFLVISGLVLETGGMLAHGSCISREYGIPAVQFADAMQRIPDGATITITGETGEITIVALPDGDEG